MIRSFFRSTILALAALAAGSPLLAQPTSGGAAASTPPAAGTVVRPLASGASPEPCALDDVSCSPPPLAREFRGLWIASVGNIDWPSRPGLPTDSAQLELRQLLDKAKATGLNAVILQVRPSGDALYASELEPWSEYLTGQQGVAPRPYWDPLKFAVDEAHARGLELHAWFNPYRARHTSAKGALSPKHLAVARPSLVRNYGRQQWMDPGEVAVRAHTVRVIVDVVKRYDIDGVHIDDYFYPYKERDRSGRLVDFPDASTFRRYSMGGGTLARDDWRRENVNALVSELYRSIHAEKPWVKFGVSPFGIWRPGFPETVVGFDAYNELYADARKWLHEGWLDYFSPQLYWPVAQRGQEYPVLLRWWAEQNAFGRHLWPGNYTSKVGEQSRTAWRTSEIEAQIRLTRAEAGASGNVHFSAKAFLEDRDSLATRLGRHVYSAPALVPPSPWLDVAPQGEPQLELRRSGTRVTLKVSPAGTESPQFWLVQTRRPDGSWHSSLMSGRVRELSVPAGADRVAIRAVDRASVEGPMIVLRVR
ncbi:MAG: family 10 glycosylhydrolase [Gemmatimonadaceae bacterium]|nr:family 10 glycosylhydrolase [Gemmatimonadaceae bacterium]